MNETTGDIPATQHAAPREAAGQHIDNYKLLQPIGEGGFGTVWMAEQREPVKRRVALKVIKLGMDTKQVIARFEAERQALAMMEHPNIAKVLDAGTTLAGRPYFVMEYIRGIPILEYCDQERVPTRKRLERFANVCNAIQHAHQKGIIHRDIKPSNILITLHDGVPVPKVIDFGIAKATNAELTNKTLFTEHRQLIGTPAYMAPEQAEMSGLDIDTRADIYSLGVLLYELLTGTTPFACKDLAAMGHAELLRTIREVTPQKPSARVSSLADTTTRIAAQRDADPKKLGVLLKGDLDWITMKCLEKDRSRRYETANALAADIDRYLNNEPVSAGPPAASYKLRKFIQRNKPQAAVAALLTVTLILGTIGTSLGMAEAIRERARSDTLAQDLETQLNRSEQVKDFVIAMLTDIEPERLGEVTREQQDRMVERTERLLDAGDIDDPAIEAEIRLMLAMYRARRIRYDESHRLAMRALTLADEALGDEHPLTLRANHIVGFSCLFIDRFDEGVARLDDTLEAQTTVLGPHHEDTITTMHWRSIATWNSGDLEGGLRHMRRVADVMREHLPPDHRLYFILNRIITSALMELGREDEAIATAERLLAEAQQQFGPARAMTAHMQRNLGQKYLAVGRTAQAVELLISSRAFHAKAQGPDHPATTRLDEDITRCLIMLGRADEAPAYHAVDAKLLNQAAWQLAAADSVEKRNPQRAEPLARQALERIDSGDTSTEREVVLDTLAMALFGTGQLERALETQRQAVALADTNGTLDEESTKLLNFLEARARGENPPDPYLTDNDRPADD